jgi:hypothetical protein
MKCPSCKFALLIDSIYLISFFTHLDNSISKSVKPVLARAVHEHPRLKNLRFAQVILVLHIVFACPLRDNIASRYKQELAGK